MLKLTDINGRSLFVAPSNVARINAADASSQWHGVQCIVRLFDGGVIECKQNADEIASLVEEAARQSKGAA